MQLSEGFWKIVKISLHMAQNTPLLKKYMCPAKRRLADNGIAILFFPIGSLCQIFCKIAIISKKDIASTCSVFLQVQHCGIVSQD